MIESGIHEALAESVREVLEKMFFVDLQDGAVGLGPEPIAAHVIFDGDPPGSFLLEMDMAAARAVSANFLSADPAELAIQQIHDVICELSNIVCGSVLSRVESRATFRLAKPEIVTSTVPDLTTDRRQDIACPPVLLEASFQGSVEGGALRSEIRLERPVCPGIDEHAF